MKNGNEKETTGFTEDELYEAAVYLMTNGLLGILTEDLGTDAHLTLGSNGFPAIDASIGNMNCRFSYFPVGDTDTDRFLLMIRTAVLPGGDEADYTARMLTCESFNLASVFGNAVFVPADGSVEYRVSVPERGGMLDPEDYRFILSMIEVSVNELKGLLEER